MSGEPPKDIKVSKNPAIQQEVESEQSALETILPKIGRRESNQLARSNVAKQLRIERLRGSVAKNNEKLIRAEMDARTDPLTSVDNLRGFMEKLNETISRIGREKRKNNGTEVEQVICATVDLNRFKRLNDEYGHMVGDAALILVAKILKTSLRPYDIIGRKSDASDEFMVAMVGADLDAARHRFEEIFQRLQTSSEAPSPVSISVGLSSLNLDDANKSLHESDLAMFKAKQRITPETDRGQSFLEVAA